MIALSGLFVAAFLAGDAGSLSSPNWCSLACRPRAGTPSGWSLSPPSATRLALASPTRLAAGCPTSRDHRWFPLSPARCSGPRLVGPLGASWLLLSSQLGTLRRHDRGHFPACCGCRFPVFLPSVAARQDRPLHRARAWPLATGTARRPSALGPQPDEKPKAHAKRQPG